MSEIVVELVDESPSFNIEITDEAPNFEINISNGSSGIIVPEEIRAALESLSSSPTDERLDASAIKNLPTGSLEWEIVSSNTSGEKNKGYLVNSLSLLSISLPLDAVVGDEIAVYGESSTTWRISQSVGQQVRVGNISTTNGNTGEILGREIGDGIHLVCVSNDSNKWLSRVVFGNIDII